MPRKKHKGPTASDVTGWLSTHQVLIQDLTETIRRDYETLADMVEPELRDDLRKQLLDVAKRIVAEEMARTTGASMLEIAEVLEDMVLPIGV